jgi:epoxyqueuosine reductase
VISAYARGRDYHKVIRQRLLQMARALGRRWSNQDAQFRACVDSAPVLEVELARQCGLGWRGKHTLLLNREQGSMFFLGVLLTDLPIAPMQAVTDPPQGPAGHCGTCTACLQACPTQAFVGPYQLDARRCISYLTIELKGSIPTAMRPLIGNRVYGCDDCQQVCPWNQYAQQATLADFDVRHGLDRATLLELLQWTEAEFIERHQGSAIMRIGYERWLRNLVVAAGNAVASADCPAEIRSGLIASLQRHRPVASDLVAEHIDWALAQGLQDRYPERDRHHGSEG